MNKLTFTSFLGYTASVLALNAVVGYSVTQAEISGAGINFTVEPTVTQKLYDKASESIDFLSKINLVQVKEITGEKLGLSARGLILGRDDLSNGKTRVPRDIHDLDPTGYHCKHVTFDVGIKWSILDSWAKFPNFWDRISMHLVKTYGQNIMTVGFNGTSYAAVTDRVANPKGEDVAVGWLQKIREHKNGIQVFDEVVAGSGTIEYGPTAAKYKNLDAVVKDGVSEFMEDWVQNEDLVCIVSRRLLDDKYFNLINENDKPTEINAMQMILANKKLGNLPAYAVPYFPNNTILITTFDNLSVYEQEKSRRRTMRDNHDRLQYEDLQSANIDFVVEDFEKTLLIENLEEV